MSRSSKRLAKHIQRLHVRHTQALYVAYRLPRKTNDALTKEKAEQKLAQMTLAVEDP